MKLIEYFEDFLENTVNLNESRLTLLNERVESITNFLEGSSAFATSFQGIIPQGSYAHKTIIKPVQSNDDFDADVLLFLEEFDNWSAKDYVENLYICFRENSIYKDKVSRKTRCVTIDYKGDFHIDIVPFLERDDSKYITNRHDDSFELTNPEGYNAWLDEKNKITSRNLVKSIRLMKYLKGFKGRFSVKSVILNVLLGDRVSARALLIDTNCYSDVPTTLHTLTKSLSDYVAARPNLPTIEDPSGTGENFSDRWNQEEYSNFRKWIMHYAIKIDEAYAETNRDESLKKWRVIFGDKFKKTEVKSTELVRVSANLPIVYKKTEQSLNDFGIATDLQTRYLVRIKGRVLRQNSMGSYYLKDRGNKVRRGRKIRFELESCNIPEPFTIYWKVLNRGDSAKQQDCIRGQIELGDRTWRIEETTKFSGPHYVECYIVKNGICVARDRQEVNID
jgi:Second Messenger Oligonucleotide or Dinucleotide Synthetase domain/Adenylyl/Guanylyl and SMODS C-terminal sensor domain